MWRVWEYIHRLHSFHPVILVKQGKVSSLRGRIAAHVDYTPGSGFQDDAHHILVHASSRWIGDDNVRPAVLAHKLVCEHGFHIASEECSVANAVETTVHLGIFYSLWDKLYANHLSRFTRDKIGNGPRASVQVVDERHALRAGFHVVRRATTVVAHRANNAVQMVSLLGVSLVKALGPHLELQVFHRLVYIISAFKGDKFQIAKGVVALLVVHIY